MDKLFYTPPKLTTLDLSDPTNQKNYVDRGLIKGTPLFWADEVTGFLKNAVFAFLNGKATPQDLQVVINYLQYVIHAPCWLNSPFPMPAETQAEINQLREQSLTLATREQVDQWLKRCLEAGIDPL